MSWETWSLFLVMVTVLCLTPGPAVMFVLSQALRRGRRAAFWSSLGILAGNTFYFILSASSLGAILFASYDLFATIRWIGAAYLVWLGVTTFIGASPIVPGGPTGGAARPGPRLVLDGFVLQASNPKALVFFTALVPQFVDPAGTVPLQMAILAATTVVVELAVLTTYGALAGRATALAAEPRFATATNRVAGSLLVAAGVGTAAIRRP
ncbi:MAG TPA: LysE family translocator [Candidatus Eisenbacteria bacterium]|nr:LysE family translocator [Candidatus Eisenbacteria bacterium]